MPDLVPILFDARVVFLLSPAQIDLQEAHPIGAADELEAHKRGVELAEVAYPVFIS